MSIMEKFLALRHRGEKANNPTTHALTLSRTSTKNGVLPKGATEIKYHQQGIQQTPQGIVVSGSSENTGYLYFTLTTTNTRSDSITSMVYMPAEYSKLGTNKYQYNHMGGFQVVGNLLAVGCEDLGRGSGGTSVVLFYDVSDFNNPSPPVLRHLERPHAGDTAGAVGICRYKNGWMLAVGNYGCKKVDFYTITPPAGAAADGDLAHFSACTMSAPQSWDSTKNAVGLDGNWGEYQNLNLFTETDDAGQTVLWMIGMNDNGILGARNEDWADLFKVTFAEGNVIVSKQQKLHFICEGDPGFLWGGGFYMDVANNRFNAYAIAKHMKDEKTTYNKFVG